MGRGGVRQAPRGGIRILDKDQAAALRRSNGLVLESIDGYAGGGNDDSLEYDDAHASLGDDYADLNPRGGQAPDDAAQQAGDNAAQAAALGMVALGNG